MYKLELKKKGKIIKSVDDWYNAAPPKNPSLHWKDGRSAKELAKYMTSTKGYMPEEIENILTKLGCNTNITFYGEPEAVTSLEGRGGGRHHDLLLVQGNKDYKELFDSISGNKFTRVNSLYNDIYGYDLYKNMELRYQLLTATEGILKEAKKANASKAVLLVITLKKEGCYSEKKVETNLQDLKNFVTSLGIPLEDGQYNLPVYHDIDFYVEHVEVEV